MIRRAAQSSAPGQVLRGEVDATEAEFRALVERRSRYLFRAVDIGGARMAVADAAIYHLVPVSRPTGNDNAVKPGFPMAGHIR